MKTILQSKSKKAVIDTDGPFMMIGEKINPTGRKKLAAALQEENYDYVRELAKKQIEADGYSEDAIGAVTTARTLMSAA